MEKSWFNLILSKGKLEYKCGLSKSMDSLGPIENTSVSENPVRNDTDKNIHGSSDSSKVGHLHIVGVKGIRNFISYDIFFFRDSNQDSYSIIYFDSENKDSKKKEGHNDKKKEEHNERSTYSNTNTESSKDSDRNANRKDSDRNTNRKDSDKNTNNEENDDLRYNFSVYSFSWTNHINSRINSYLCSKVGSGYALIESSSDSNNYNDSFIYNYICGEGGNSSEGKNFNINDNDANGNDLESSNDNDFDENDLESSNDNDFDENDLESSNDFDENDLESSNDFDENGNDLKIKIKSPFAPYKHLWVQCENCYGVNYKKFFKSKWNICEHCGYHLKMHSSDRIEVSIDPGTWVPMDEHIISLDPIGWDEFDSEEGPYKNRIDSYQKKTGLNEAIQTGTGQLNGIPIAIGVMDFQFMGGSMGSVVGEKITRLIEYATKNFLPLILVCASGGARMQEGSLSLMQMAKISSALYDYQSNKKLFYISILTSPTTGGVTASFGMLGDIIIAEPNAYIAFAGKRVIEQTLNVIVPEGSQEAEPLFDKGLFDPIVPRNPLKGVLSELVQFHGFFPLNQNSINSINN